jgi:predicted transcriptional regulator
MNPVKQMRQDVKKYIDKADETTVKMVHAMLEVKQEKDWWDKLPENVQAEIDHALAELDTGKGMSHEMVMKKYSKWFTR